MTAEMGGARMMVAEAELLESWQDVLAPLWHDGLELVLEAELVES